MFLRTLPSSFLPTGIYHLCSHLLLAPRFFTAFRMTCLAGRSLAVRQVPFLPLTTSNAAQGDFSTSVEMTGRGIGILRSSHLCCRECSLLIFPSNLFFPTAKTPESSQCRCAVRLRRSASMNRPGVAAEAECLCRQGRTGIAIVATVISDRSFFRSFGRYFIAGAPGGRRDSRVMVSILPPPFPWIKRFRDEENFHQAFPPLWPYSLEEWRQVSEGKIAPCFVLINP